MAKDKKLTTLAALWDDTDASEASNGMPEGQHTARLNKAELSEKEDKGIAVFFEYEILDGENEGKKGRQMYKLTDADGAKTQGMAYLKRDMALLEYDDVTGKKLTKALTELTEAQPMVLITVKHSAQYVNCFLNGLAEDQDGGGDSEEESEESEGREIEEGSEVTFTFKKKEYTGIVESIDGDEAEVDVKGKSYTVDLVDLTLVESEEEEAEEEEDADPEIEVGSKVSFDDEDGDTITGEVTKIDDDLCVVEDEDGKKHKKISIDDLTLVEEEEEEEEEAEVEFEKGDDVTFTDPDDDDEELEGAIVSVKGDVAKVKVGKKTYEVDLSDLTKAD